MHLFRRTEGQGGGEKAGGWAPATHTTRKEGGGLSFHICSLLHTSLPAGSLPRRLLPFSGREEGEKNSPNCIL